MLFQSFVQRTFSIDELIVLLEENTARNREFDYDRFELADMDTYERTENFFFFFKHDLPELSWPLHLPEGGKRGIVIPFQAQILTKFTRHVLS